MNVKIYQCFRAGASQSIHNMCGSRNFYQGGGGGIQTRRQKTALTAFFLLFFFLCVVLNLLTEWFQWFNFREGLSLSRGSNFSRNGGGGGGGGGGGVLKPIYNL